MQRSRFAWCLVGLAVVAEAGLVLAQSKTATGQNLLQVDWASPELVAFRAAPNAQAGVDAARLAALRVPVLAFGDIPQIVKNVAGPSAQPIKPRNIITDAAAPYWYRLVDTYDGITITVDADRRINHELSKGFQIGAARNGAAATLGGTGAGKISILDNSSEEGMEGVILEYTIQKFPDIPYTVTIACSGKAKTQCKDLSVITKDEALLRVIATGKG